MGTLTLAEFQTEILATLGGRTENTAVNLARIVVALNMAQQRIDRDYAFTEMQEVTFAQLNFTGAAEVDKYLVPPPNVRTIHSFVLLDTSAGLSSQGASRKLRMMPWRQFDQLIPSPQWLAPGWPEVYTWWGQFLVMAPAPFLQFTAQLRYVKRPTPFSVDELTQVSDYAEKDDILIMLASAYLWRTLGRADRATSFEADAKVMLDEAIERAVEQPDMDVGRTGRQGVLSGAYWANPFIESVN